MSLSVHKCRKYIQQLRELKPDICTNAFTNWVSFHFIEFAVRQIKKYFLMNLLESFTLENNCFGNRDKVRR